VNAFRGSAADEDRTLGATNVTAKGGTLAERYARRFCWPTDKCGDGAPSKRGVVRGSLVADIDIPDFDEDFSDDDTRRRNDKIHPVRRNGYIVRIADFGTIAIGEVILKEQQRTINMLRFNLGSPIDGSGTACSSTTNGLEMVP
jgi:hypothetical protein